MGGESWVDCTGGTWEGVSLTALDGAGNLGNCTQLFALHTVLVDGKERGYTYYAAHIRDRGRWGSARGPGHKVLVAL